MVRAVLLACSRAGLLTIRFLCMVIRCTLFIVNGILFHVLFNLAFVLCHFLTFKSLKYIFPILISYSHFNPRLSPLDSQEDPLSKTSAAMGNGPAIRYPNNGPSASPDSFQD